MNYLENLWLFFMLLTGILLVPGMDMGFVLANAVTGGRRAGLSATFGLMLGGAFHTLFGAFAATTLGKLVPVVAVPMLTIGSLYMIWIGFTLVRRSIVVGASEKMPVRAFSVIFWQAVATCLLNPKAWLFILAVYPQFIRPAFGPMWPQALAMGAITVFMQFVVYGGVASMAARGRDALLSRQVLTIWTGRLVGALLIFIAVWTLFREWSAL